MKKSFLLLCMIVCAATMATAQTELEIADQKAHETLSKMTLDEKLTLIDGRDFDIQSIERVGIKRVHMYDGPIGVRESTSTAFPASVMLAATWNPQLGYDYGYALGRDCRARGVNIILGPGVNIYRSPRNARNFEYLGEDPVLTSAMAVGYIKGVQANKGVIACVKHFAANNPESGRYDVSSDVDERTLQEIYLPAFKAAVQEANVGSLMSSYNRIWGTWTSENKWLMHDVLRNEWHFPFISMTDWGAAHHTAPIVKNGVDLEMPGNSVMTLAKVKPLIESGQLTEEMINYKVLNILRTCYYFHLYDYDKPDQNIPLDNKESAQTAYNVAKEGFVLLKNEGVLPINNSVKSICITGHNAIDYVSGGGSSIVTPYHKTSAYESIKALCDKQGIKIEYKELEANPDVTVQVCYADEKIKKHGIFATYFANQDLNGKPVDQRIEATVHSPWLKRPIKGITNTDSRFSARYQTWVKVNEDGNYIFSVSGDDGYRMTVDGQTIVDDWHDGTARLFEKEMPLKAGKVYPVVVEYFQSGGGCSVDIKVNRIDPNGQERIRKELQAYNLVIVCEGFDKNLEAEGGDRTFALNSDRESVLESAANSGVPTIAIINAGGNVESQQWEPKVKGLIWAWYAGQEGNRALAEILFGQINPSGKLPMTFERKAEDNPSFYTYSDQGHKHVQWTEGLFIGYRGYEKNNVKPLYPFGFGLSYTTFQLSQLKASNPDKDGNIKVTVKVKNTGSRDGAEVVQLYVGKDGESPVLRPIKELKTFKKVNLKAGEEQTVDLSFKADALRYFDVSCREWTSDPGKYKLSAGTSSADIVLTETIEIEE